MAAGAHCSICSTTVPLREVWSRRQHSPFHATGVPPALDRISLDYFARAPTLLARQPGVDPRHVLAWSVSGGGEAARLLGVHYPELVHEVIATSTSDHLSGGLSRPEPGRVDSEPERPAAPPPPSCHVAASAGKLRSAAGRRESAGVHDAPGVAIATPAGETTIPFRTAGRTPAPPWYGARAMLRVGRPHRRARADEREFLGLQGR